MTVNTDVSWTITRDRSSSYLLNSVNTQLENGRVADCDGFGARNITIFYDQFSTFEVLTTL